MGSYLIQILCLLLSFEVHADRVCSNIFKKIIVSEQYQTYLNDTLNSLEMMRGENGFLKDTIEVRKLNKKDFFTRSLIEGTSPTNIAVDLLIQAEIFLNKKTPKAEQNLKNVLQSLKKADFHHDTGLFFSRYSVDKKTSVKDQSVSSIDNLHLALALWTLKENFTDNTIGRQASQLFSRMDFSVYYDKSSGLIGGNLRYDNGRWIKEDYNFSNFGSEARLLYSLGWALNMISGETNGVKFYSKALNSLHVEIKDSKKGPLLKLWDGSAFQLYFPKIFLEEKNYSSLMDSIYNATAEYMLSEGGRRRLDFPAAHSATRANLLEKALAEPAYKDKSGIKGLISQMNRDISDARLEAQWDTSFSPYALFMAATDAPKQFAKIFSKIQKYPYPEFPLYVEGLGWMDSVFVKGKKRGSVVPAQLSLNQGMLALSLLKIISHDGQTLSSRTLRNNNEVNKKIQLFYQLFEEKMSDTVKN